MSVKFIYDDGGRSKYFKADRVGDCVARAITIATGDDYLKVYQTLSEVTGETPRNGVRKKDSRKFIENHLGWRWVALMGIGTGCRIHLRADELPQQGTIILKLSKHLACFKDGVLYDTYDCSRDGTRCVYGYWIK